MLGAVDRAEPDRRWSIGPLRASMYFVALLIASLGVLFASVESILPFATRVTAALLGLLIATTLVLWAHRSFGWLTLASMVVLSLAFVLPGLLIRSTPTPCPRHSITPCDPGLNGHLGLRVGFAAALIGVAFVIAVVGTVRTSRSD